MRYMVGVLQVISGSIMLWAIFRLWRSIKHLEELRDLFDLRMISLHIFTFAISLVSVIIYYVCYHRYTESSFGLRAENIFYSVLTLSNLLLTLAQAVLIYLLWGLSSE